MVHKPSLFRLFISSTFSDMTLERNTLQEQVYPRLHQLCARYGARFQAIDLRWGISQEAGLNQRATDVCLNEIARCQRATRRPNFLLLMGDRYGWQPLPDEIPVDEWDVLILRMSSDEQNHLQHWYWRDDNAIPPVYVLQPRRGEYVEQDIWSKVETRLRQILCEALDGLNWSHEKRMKYETSVTEQEIEAGVFQYTNAHEGAFCLFREIRNLPSDTNQFQDADPQAQAQLAKLKQRLRDTIPDNIYDYQANWAENNISFDTARFAAFAYKVLSKAIKAELATFNDVNSLVVEQSEHDKFVLEHTRNFVGRVDIFENITQYLNSEKNTALVVYGSSGVGKSSVIAKAAQANPNAIYRFVGISPESSNIRSLLIDICEIIKKHYRLEDAIPQDYESLIKAFHAFLLHANRSDPLVIFIDGLDQFTNINTPSDLRWLPNALPNYVKFILSAIPGSYLDTLKHRVPSENFVELTSMPKEEASILLDQLLSEVGRKITEAQRSEVIDKFGQNGLPLYLKLAFEEAKLWHSFHQDFELKPDVPSLIRDNLFARLSDKAEHGGMLVSRSLAYIQASRNGLTEDEILDIMSSDKEFWGNFEARTHEKQRTALQYVKRLPIAVWSRLYLDLEPYFIERSMDGAVVFSFYHRQFSEAVDEFYVKLFRRECHTHLAHYFETLPLRIYDIANARKVSEQAYQQAKANLETAYVDTLTDYRYLETSLDVHGVQQLIVDLSLMESEIISLIRSALSVCAHVLAEDKTALGPQLVGRLAGYRKFNERIRHLTDWIVQQVPGIYPMILDSDYHVLIQAGGNLAYSLYHGAKVEDAVFSPNGELIGSICSDGHIHIWSVETRQLLRSFVGSETQINSIAFSPDGELLINTSSNGTINIWYTRTGQLYLTIDSCNSPVVDLVCSPDGRFIGSAHSDGNIRIWDIKTGQLTKVLEGDTDSVKQIAFSPNGQHVVAAGGDCTARVWDLSKHFPKGAILLDETEQDEDYYGHKDSVEQVLFTPNGNHIITISEAGLIVWDAHTWQIVNTFKDIKSTTSVSISADGTEVVGCYYFNQYNTNEGTVRIWDIQTGQILQNLSGHTDAVNNVEFSPDGKLILSASDDNFVRVWERFGQNSPPSLVRYKTKVTTVAFSPDGRHVLSAAQMPKQEVKNNRVQVWDVHTGDLYLSLGNDLSAMGVEQASFSPDGKQILVKGGGTHIHNAHTGKLQCKLKGAALVNDVLFSADGKYVSGASGKTYNREFRPQDNVAQIWNAKSGKLLLTLTGHADQVNSVSISPNSKYIATGSFDGTVRIWDAQNGEALLTLTGHGKSVESVSFTSDEQHVVSVDSACIRIWDLKTGSQSGETRNTLSERARILRDLPTLHRIDNRSYKNSIGWWADWTDRMICLYSADGTLLGRFYADADISTCDISIEGGIVAGDKTGRLMVLQYKGAETPRLQTTRPKKWWQLRK